MIGMAVEAPYGLFVAAKSPLKSGKQFFDDAKHKEITVGSTSPSSAAHMVMEMVKFKSKAKMLYVPYSGSGPAVTDLIGGQIEGFFVTAPPLVGQVKGGILFVEDVSEHPYRIERMLTQLLHAGALAQQKAVVLGQFTGYRLAPHDKGFKLQSVVDWLRTQIKAPVLTNLPFGHVDTKVLLPVGASVSLSAEGRDALLYWGHQH